jgi:hypothetical protein
MVHEYMDVGWGGVIFIWIGFLWPVIVTSLFMLLKSSAVKKGSKFILSVAGGYAAMFVGNFLAIGCAKVLTSDYLLGNSGASFEKYFGSLMNIVFILFMVLPPIGVAFYISKIRNQHS